MFFVFNLQLFADACGFYGGFGGIPAACVFPSEAAGLGLRPASHAYDFIDDRYLVSAGDIENTLPGGIDDHLCMLRFPLDHDTENNQRVIFC